MFPSGISGIPPRLPLPVPALLSPPPSVLRPQPSVFRPQSSAFRPQSPVRSPALINPLFILLFVVINSVCPENGLFTPIRASTSHTHTSHTLTSAPFPPCYSLLLIPTSVHPLPRLIHSRTLEFSNFRTSPPVLLPSARPLQTLTRSHVSQRPRFTLNRASTSNAQTLTRLKRSHTHTSQTLTHSHVSNAHTSQTLTHSHVSHARNCPISPLLFVVINSLPLSTRALVQHSPPPFNWEMFPVGATRRYARLRGVSSGSPPTNALLPLRPQSSAPRLSSIVRSPPLQLDTVTSWLASPPPSISSPFQHPRPMPPTSAFGPPPSVLHPSAFRARTSVIPPALLTRKC